MRHGFWAVSMLGAVALGMGCKGPAVQTVFAELLVTPADGGTFPDGGVLFPLTAYGSSSRSTIQIQSTSSIDLHISAFLFDGGDWAIESVQGDGGPVATPLTIPSNTSENFTLVFTPTAPHPIPDAPAVPESAGLIIQSDSNDKPDYPLPLWGNGAASRIDLCTTENGNLQCLSGNPNLAINFPRGPVGSLIGPARIDISNQNDVPLTIFAITLDDAALDAGFSLVETDAQLGLPKKLSASTGLTVPFHVIMHPTQVCEQLPDGGSNNNCLTGSVSVSSSDPHYVAPALPKVGLLGTGNPDESPLACIGITQITYVNGNSVVVDPSMPLDQQNVYPPGPLDSATFTALPIQNCSGSPQNLDFNTAFSLTTPDGSFAGFSPNGTPGQAQVQFDLTGSYSAYVLVTELPDGGFQGGTNLPTADAGISIVVAPHDDLSVVLNWNSVAPVDMDLHLIRVYVDGGAPPPAISLMVSPDNDCFWCNCYLHQSGACGPAYSRPTAADWGAPGYQNTPPDDPLLTAYGYKEEYETPLNEAVTNVGSLEPGTEYDVYVHYYQIQNGADAGCPDGGGTKRPDGGDFECTDPDYPFCSLQECVPLVHAQIRVFVAGQEVSGSPNTADIGRICDLWHAGVLHWASGGTLPDGGFATPSFVFVPTPGITAYYDPKNIPQIGTGTCVLPLQ